MSDAPCCAHARVQLKPEKHADGTYTDRWVCSDCEPPTEFVPKVWRDSWKARAEKAEEQHQRWLKGAMAEALEKRAEAEKRAERAEGLHLEAENESMRVIWDERKRAEAAEAALRKTEDLLVAVTKRNEEQEDALAKLRERVRRAEEGVTAVDRLRIAEKEEAREALAKVTEERDAALKACAEVRKALERIKDDGIMTTPTGRRMMDSALSSDAGRGYASPDERRALAEKAYDSGWAAGYREDKHGRASDLAALLGREG